MHFFCKTLMAAITHCVSQLLTHYGWFGCHARDWSLEHVCTTALQQRLGKLTSIKLHTHGPLSFSNIVCKSNTCGIFLSFWFVFNIARCKVTTDFLAYKAGNVRQKNQWHLLWCVAFKFFFFLPLQVLKKSPYAHIKETQSYIRC